MRFGGEAVRCNLLSLLRQDHRINEMENSDANSSSWEGGLTADGSWFPFNSFS
jgi:hypothetical protein